MSPLRVSIALDGLSIQRFHLMPTPRISIERTRHQHRLKEMIPPDTNIE
jgi:hypothetical protein